MNLCLFDGYYSSNLQFYRGDMFPFLSCTRDWVLLSFPSTVVSPMFEVLTVHTVLCVIACLSVSKDIDFTGMNLTDQWTVSIVSFRLACHGRRDMLFSMN